MGDAALPIGWGLSSAQRAGVLEIRGERNGRDSRAFFARATRAQKFLGISGKTRVEGRFAVKRKKKKKLAKMLDSRQLVEYDKLGPELKPSASALRGAAEPDFLSSKGCPCL